MRPQITPGQLSDCLVSCKITEACDHNSKRSGQRTQTHIRIIRGRHGKEDGLTECPTLNVSDIALVYLHAVMLPLLDLLHKLLGIVYIEPTQRPHKSKYLISGDCDELADTNQSLVIGILGDIQTISTVCNHLVNLCRRGAFRGIRVIKHLKSRHLKRDMTWERRKKSLFFGL